MDGQQGFNYFYSYDVPTPVRVKIGTLEGELENLNCKDRLDNPVLHYARGKEKCPPFIVECKLHANGNFLPLSTFTAYKHFTTRWNWNEWLELPIRYCDLPRDAKLLLTLLEYQRAREMTAIGGTTISLFDKHGVYRRGLQDLKVWPETAAKPNDTPGLPDEKDDRMDRLNKLVKQHESGRMIQVDWMDRLVFREIEMINDHVKRSSNFMYLMIEFPKCVYQKETYNIIYSDPKCTPENYNENKVQKNGKIYDPELGLENLHERKHHYLTRSSQSEAADRDLKPNSVNRDNLFKIIQYPPTKQLANSEQDLIWKYRYFLSSQKKGFGLAKFLKCVNWNLPKEAKQASNLLHEWTPVDAQDALELLGPGFTYPKVRRYAVERLSKASDNELLLYLLQLVQALKYEPWDQKSMNLLDVSHYSISSESSSVNKFEGNSTPDDSIYSDSPKEVSATSQVCDSTSTLSATLSACAIDNEKDLLIDNNVCDDKYCLSSFLIRRACENHVLANYFYWYLSIECENKFSDQMPKPECKVKEMYLWVMSLFKIAMQQHSPKSKATWQTLLRQQHFVEQLVSLVVKLNKETSGRLKKIEKLQELIADPELNLSDFESLPLPLDPEVNICGLIPDRATLFKSALEPCKLTFKTSEGAEYITIFKYGDDLRQDQLILQIITLMNDILLKENMDLKLTPYKVLPTSSKHGFVQYIDSYSIAEILRTDGTIQNFLRSHAPCEGAPYGIAPNVLDTYIRSCAGYCVITYILGIGDRHFDNLLITRKGNLFHIDFGYILGRDPKPLPPPMKLTKEMVEGMGGQTSETYLNFRRQCNTTFMQLRRHSSLVLNLFSMMVDASVPDIVFEPDRTTFKVEEKFCLAMSEDEAISHFQEIIDASVGAMFAAVVEQFHRFAQYIRK